MRLCKQTKETRRAWIKAHERPLTLLFVLAVMLLIFCFSAQSGVESAAASGRIVRFAIRLFYRGYHAMNAAGQRQLYERVSFFVRKGAHFSEYTLLGFALLLHVSTLGRRRPKLLSALIGVLYACTDELHQTLVAGRGPALRDVAIDAAGVLFGLLLLELLRRIRRKRRRRQLKRQTREAWHVPAHDK